MATLRIAAGSDFHAREGEAGRFAPGLLHAARGADLLLLGGDLTERGSPPEIDVFCREITGITVPMIAVLGNHDVYSGHTELWGARLRDAGVILLEGNSCTVETPAGLVGIAGVMGHGGGYTGRLHSEDADLLRESLLELGPRVVARIAMTHYCPTPPAGEKPALYPELGCAEFACAADVGGADLYVHGHAHYGQEMTRTPGGVPVRNVACRARGWVAAVYHLDTVTKAVQRPADGLALPKYIPAGFFPQPRR